MYFEYEWSYLVVQYGPWALLWPQYLERCAEAAPGAAIDAATAITAVASKPRMTDLCELE
jgi:hypothetical protein